MLDPEMVELTDLALALEDQSHEHTWWLDPATGEVHPRFRDALEDEVAPRRLIAIEPLPKAVGYADMEDFVAYVRDPHARYLLEQAIVGRGAFRRFKDTLLDFPDLRQIWFAFHDSRGERRAIEWLVDQNLVDQAAAERAIARRGEPGPEELPSLLDAQGLARRAAGDLRRLYRERLKDVLLLGPWARGDANPESPVELLVVLDSVGDRWEEKRRMERIMWRHSVRNDTVVTEIPVTEAELERGATPLLMRALAEGVRAV
jgi:Uncharacterised protein family (UPF0158)